jgi:hypothetical protein
VRWCNPASSELQERDNTRTAAAAAAAGSPAGKATHRGKGTVSWCAPAEETLASQRWGFVAEVVAKPCASSYCPTLGTSCTFLSLQPSKWLRVCLCCVIGCGVAYAAAALKPHGV